MTETVLVRPAGLADARTIAVLLGRAGHDEAVFGWVVPDESDRRACAQKWVESAPDWLGALLPAGELLLAGDESNPSGGLSVWEHRAASSAAVSAAAGTDEQQAAFLARAYGRYAPRMALVGELIAARHPDGRPYWYLQQMVVLPELRGRGLGGAMLRHQLRRADADGIGSYLEASSPRNRALYQRYGFRSCAEPIRLPDGGPTLQPMWREPHPGQPPS
ncbi:GNAT family N-acetyltransferase [Plantactinospora sp. WMMB782]|uniref:GNAT family N-acetyltransferase n=1 Tax=Plantactinospora sp. WMMB782 TaxID=3404121 RepID=UPI003B930EA1